MPEPTLLVAPFTVFASGGGERQPVVAAGTNGRFIVSTETDGDIQAVVFSGSTILQGSEIVSFSIATSAFESNADAAILANGDVVVVHEAIVVSGPKVFFSR